MPIAARRPPPVTITAAACAGAPVRPTQPILCNGGNSIVTVSADWRHACLTAARARSAVPAGTYSFTVTDANSCTGDHDRNDHSAERGSRQFVQHSDPVQRRQFDRDGERRLAAPRLTAARARSAMRRGPTRYTVTDANSCTATTTGNDHRSRARWWPVRPHTAILCNGGNSIVTVSARLAAPALHRHGHLQPFLRGLTPSR